MKRDVYVPQEFHRVLFETPEKIPVKMTNEEIAKALQRLAGQILCPPVHHKITCNYCGYKDEVPFHRIKRATKTKRGYVCDRCLSCLRHLRRSIVE